VKSSSINCQLRTRTYMFLIIRQHHRTSLPVGLTRKDLLHFATQPNMVQIPKDLSLDVVLSNFLRNGRKAHVSLFEGRVGLSEWPLTCSPDGTQQAANQRRSLHNLVRKISELIPTMGLSNQVSYLKVGNAKLLPDPTNTAFIK